MSEVRVLNNMDDDEVFTFAKKISAPYDLVAQTKQMGMVVVHFASGGIMTPADEVLMMQLGCGVFVGSEVFDGPDPFTKLMSIVQVVQHYNDPHVLAEMSSGFENAMESLSVHGDRIQDFNQVVSDYGKDRPTSSPASNLMSPFLLGSCRPPTPVSS